MQYLDDTSNWSSPAEALVHVRLWATARLYIWSDFFHVRVMDVGHLALSARSQTDGGTLSVFAGCPSPLQVGQSCYAVPVELRGFVLKPEF